MVPWLWSLWGESGVWADQGHAVLQLAALFALWSQWQKRLARRGEKLPVGQGVEGTLQRLYRSVAVLADLLSNNAVACAARLARLGVNNKG